MFLGMAALLVTPAANGQSTFGTILGAVRALRSGTQGLLMCAWRGLSSPRSPGQARKPARRGGKTGRYFHVPRHLRPYRAAGRRG